MFNLQPNQYWDGGNWRWNYGNMFYVYQVLSYLNIYSFNNDGSAGANIINIASSKLDAVTGGVKVAQIILTVQDLFTGH